MESEYRDKWGILTDEDILIDVVVWRLRLADRYDVLTLVKVLSLLIVIVSESQDRRNFTSMLKWAVAFYKKIFLTNSEASSAYFSVAL